MGILDSIFGSSPEVDALRRRLASERAEAAQASYQRLQDECAAQLQAVRDMFDPQRKSRGGNMPDDIVDQQIAGLKSTLDALLADHRRVLGI